MQEPSASTAALARFTHPLPAPGSKSVHHQRTSHLVHHRGLIGTHSASGPATRRSSSCLSQLPTGRQYRLQVVRCEGVSLTPSQRRPPPTVTLARRERIAPPCTPRRYPPCRVRQRGRARPQSHSQAPRRLLPARHAAVVRTTCPAASTHPTSAARQQRQRGDGAVDGAAGGCESKGMPPTPPRDRVVGKQPTRRPRDTRRQHTATQVNDGRGGALGEHN